MERTSSTTRAHPLTFSCSAAYHGQEGKPQIGLGINVHPHVSRLGCGGKASSQVSGSAGKARSPGRLHLLVEPVGHVLAGHADDGLRQGSSVRRNEVREVVDLAKNADPAVLRAVVHGELLRRVVSPPLLQIHCTSGLPHGTQRYSRRRRGKKCARKRRARSALGRFGDKQEHSQDETVVDNEKKIDGMGVEYSTFIL
eukprot:scaffold380_cov272-Pinguiococcus_pyrenoidosus.AAC.13